MSTRVTNLLPPVPKLVYGGPVVLIFESFLQPVGYRPPVTCHPTRPGSASGLIVKRQYTLRLWKICSTSGQLVVPFWSGLSHPSSREQEKRRQQRKPVQPASLIQETMARKEAVSLFTATLVGLQRMCIVFTNTVVGTCRENCLLSFHQVWLLEPTYCQHLARWPSQYNQGVLRDSPHKLLIFISLIACSGPVCTYHPVQAAVHLTAQNVEVIVSMFRSSRSVSACISFCLAPGSTIVLRWKLQKAQCIQLPVFLPAGSHAGSGSLVYFCHVTQSGRC